MTSRLVPKIEPTIPVTSAEARFRLKLHVGDTVFCCVDIQRPHLDTIPRLS